MNVPIQPILEVLLVLSATAVIAAVAPFSDRPQSLIRSVGVVDSDTFGFVS